MAQGKLPAVTVELEFRGIGQGGEFRNESGELVTFTEGLRFEAQLADGDVSIITLRSSALDHCSPPIDWKSLKKGDRVRVTAEVGGDYYLRPQSVVPIEGENARPVKAA